MSSVCVVGLPTQLRTRLEAACRRQGVHVTLVLAGNGKEGILWLLPHPREVKQLLLAYVDGLPAYPEARIIVLPYVDVPGDVLDELAVLEESGAQITWPKLGEGVWPILASKNDFDEPFRNALFSALAELLLVPDEAPAADLPSTYFVNTCSRSPNLLLASAVLRRCDAVTTDRYQFMREAADAFEALLQRGPGIRLEEFFNARKLEHAQSGGITAKLTVMKGGRAVYSNTTQAHLKRGDATTRASAARIYYHRFVIGEVTYIAVLHAGPHPDRDVDVTLTMEAAKPAE